MKKLILTFAMGLLLAAPSYASAQINLFACEPEWAALAEEIGGDKIKAYAATHAKQDPHHIRARPSLIAKIRNADIVLCSGGGLEEGWLPLLLQKAAAELQPSQVGYLMASDFVPLLEKPKHLDRSLGHLHATGNPHVHTNPHNILRVAKELTKRLKTIDFTNAPHYQSRYEGFSRRWNAAIAKWETQAAPLKGKQVITHHRSFSYLLDWLGLKLVDTLEPKPGVPPTSSQLESLLGKARNTKSFALLRTPYEPSKPSGWLSAKSDITAIVLPYTIGGSEKASNLFDLFDETIKRLVSTHNAKP